MDETVRVVRGDGAELAHMPDRRERTGPQRHMDVALDAAAQDATEALVLVESAVEWLETITPSKNRDAPHYVRKLVEEITEVRRVRG